MCGNTREAETYHGGRYVRARAAMQCNGRRPKKTCSRARRRVCSPPPATGNPSAIAGSSHPRPLPRRLELLDLGVRIG